MPTTIVREESNVYSSWEEFKQIHGDDFRIIAVEEFSGERLTLPFVCKGAVNKSGVHVDAPCIISQHLQKALETWNHSSPYLTEKRIRNFWRINVGDFKGSNVLHAILKLETFPKQKAIGSLIVSRHTYGLHHVPFDEIKENDEPIHIKPFTSFFKDMMLPDHLQKLTKSSLAGSLFKRFLERG